MIIVIEGVDGVGKGTQSQLLSSRFKSSGYNCLSLSFPNYKSFFGEMVGEYLNGTYGTLEAVNPKLTALLYALDRWHYLQKYNLSAYDTIVIDRYVPSNLAHQGAKVDENIRKDFIEWISRLEYEIFNIPKPDFVILLDANIELAVNQILKKQPRQYTDSRKDIHEIDNGYLHKVREVFLEISKACSNYYVVNCEREKNMRNINEIHEEIWEVIINKLQMSPVNLKSKKHL